MRLIFSATLDCPSYLAEDVRAYDGNVVTVPLQRGRQLLKNYSRNFRPFGSPSLKRLNPPLKELHTHPLVDILIPQRGRPNQIKRCPELILKNTSYPNYGILVICDRDDLASVKEIPKHIRIKIVVDPSPGRQMFVGKVNYGFKISKAPYLVYLANDVEVGKNWLTEAMKTMLGSLFGGIGLVAFNHGDPQKHAYHGLISRKFVNQYLKGNIFYPGYIHFWCDLELVAIAKRHNRFCFSPKSRVFHKPIKDAIHAEGWRESYQQGASLLMKRSQMGFPL